jgi:hypothetical protein
VWYTGRMAQRDQPNLARVREAMRRHDAREDEDERDDEDRDKRDDEERDKRAEQDDAEEED